MAMSYYQGMGALPAASWCSPANPQGRCRPIAGICKPMDTTTLAVYRDLQAQANRVAHARGLAKIDVDGRIGPDTVALVESVTMASYGQCDQVAAIADELAQAIRGTADALGAPASVSAPQTRPPLLPMPDGTVQDPMTGSAFGGGFGDLGMFGWALLAGAGYLLWQEMAKTSKKDKKRARRRT
jgi:hypothetical protein